jgi:hypothetical protein
MAETEDVPEAALDPQVRDLAGWAAKVFYWTLWPIGIGIYYLLYYISFVVLFVLRLIYRPLEFILLPVFYLLQFVLNCLLAPFQFLAKFEVIICATSQKANRLRLARPSTSTLASPRSLVLVWDLLSASSTIS